MFTRTRYMLLFALCSICVCACGEDEETGGNGVCNDTRFTNPTYEQGFLHLTVDGHVINDTTRKHIYSSTFLPDSTVDLKLFLIWSRPNTTNADQHTELVLEKHFTKNSITAQDAYDFLAPRRFALDTGVTAEKFDLAVTLAEVPGQPQDGYNVPEDAGNHFEITSRSPMYTHPDGFLATRIEGIFCCTATHWSSNSSVTMQGNFSGEIRLE